MPLCQNVQVAVTTRRFGKDVPYAHVFIADCLDHYRALAPATGLLIHSLERHRALRPMPMAAVKTTDTARQALLCIALHNPLEVSHCRGTQVKRLVLLQNERN